MGSLLNVSSHNETTTKYDYVSDISGLFDVSNEPQYIDYNPATNYTGYTNYTPSPDNPTGINYTSSVLANNYRIPVRIPTETDGPSGTVDNNTSLPQVDTGGKTPASNRLATAEYIHSNPFQSFLSGFKVATVYDWAVATFGDLNNYSSIKLTVTIGDYTHPSTRGSFCSRFTMETGTTIDYNFHGSPGTNYYELNIQDLTITYYLGDTPYQASMYETYLCYGDAEQIESYLGYSNGSFEWQYSSDDTTLSFTYTSRVTEATQYDYLLPSAGVYTSSYADRTVWDNDTANIDYDNQIIDIVFGPKFNNGTWAPMDTGTVFSVWPTDNPQPLQVAVVAGTFGVLNGAPDSPEYDLPDFKAFMLRFQKTDTGTDLTLFGVTSFTDYLNLSVGPVPLFTYSTPEVVSLDSLTFMSNGNISWSVYRTNVFMDTYGAVLVDPSINLANYWPDMSSYRYAFQSFALYGDSITINGVTYPVVDQTITINNKAYVLDNFYLSFSEQGETSITFNNINKTVSLGETTDKTVSFSGYWGFTTGLYEGQTDIKKVYDWSIKLLGDNLNTIVLIALGLVAVLMLACKWLGMPFRMTDKIVLAGAGLFMVLLLVV